MRSFKKHINKGTWALPESRILAEDPEEEISMMMNQLSFICYAADEMANIMEDTDGMDPEEWWQNKLAVAHSEIQTLYAYMQGRNQQNEAVDSKKFDVYKKHMKTHNLDEPTVRMAHDNPDHGESKRMMKNPKYSKGLELYKASMKEATYSDTGWQKPDGMVKEANMTAAQKAKFDALYKQHLNGKQHKILRQTIQNPIKADSAYHSMIKTLAMKEDTQIDEAKLSQQQRDRLDDLIFNVMITGNIEYDGKDNPTRHLKTIEKEFGPKVAKQVEAGMDIKNWGRDNHSSGFLDSLAYRKKSRISASGKMNKQDAVALGKRIMQDKSFSGLTKKVKLPEEAQIDEISMTKMAAYAPKAVKSRNDAKAATHSADSNRVAKAGETIRKRKAGADNYNKKMWGYGNVAPTKESVELDEVSQETLKSYHAKSALDLRNKRDKLEKGTLTTKDHKQGQNRVTGLNRAANKMDESEINDITAQYINENNITLEELENMTEEELNELIGKAIGGAFKLGAKAIVGATRLAKRAVVNKQGNIRGTAAAKADKAGDKAEKMAKQREAEYKRVKRISDMKKRASDLDKKISDLNSNKTNK